MSRLAVFSIGIDQLEADEDSLLFAARDATEYFQFCLKRFDVGHGVCVTDGPESDILPTRNNILSALSSFFESCREAKLRRAILYFAGHGFEHNGKFVYCPWDFDENIASFSGVLLEQILELANNFNGSKLFIFDCCRSLFFPETEEFAVRNEFRVSRITLSYNDICWFACRSGETAMESGLMESDYGGLFTHHLATEIWKTRSSEETYAKVFEQVKLEVSAQAAELNQSQTPIAFGGDLSSFVFPSLSENEIA